MKRILESNQRLTALKLFTQFATKVSPAITSDEIMALESQLHLDHFPKGDHFCRQGDTFSQLGLLISGLICSQYEREDGKVHVKRFIRPGQPTGAYPTAVSGKVSYSLVALEDTMILHFDYKVLVDLYEKSHDWEKLGRTLLEKEVILRNQREYQLFIYSATQRYEAFLQEHPGLENQIPQYLIASYLGITPVALSRIRSKRS